MSKNAKWSTQDIADSMLLYAVTDPRLVHDNDLGSDIKAAIAGGATFIQLRNKETSCEELVIQAEELIRICSRAGVPFVIDDDVMAAKMSGADGVHVGQEDDSCEFARRILGEEAIVGVSVQTVAQALEAERSGADYLGVGAVFSTSTKLDAVDVSYSELKAICEAVSIPVVAIGGINSNNVRDLAGSGIDGIAVVSAIFGAEDIEDATRVLKKEAETYLK